MEPLPLPAIRLLAREILNRTEVDAADSVVLVAHTRVLSLSYFGCHTHALVGTRCAAVPPAGRRDGPERELRRCAFKRRCERWRSRRSPQRRLSRPRS